MRVWKLSFTGAQAGQWLTFLGLVTVFAGSSLSMAGAWPQPRWTAAFDVVLPADLRTSYARVVHNVQLFEDRQQRQHSAIINDQQLQNMISEVELDASSGNFSLARQDVAALQKTLDNLNFELAGGTASGGEVAANIFLPILIYHYTPPNFEDQLTYLEQHGYTVIDMNEVVQGLHGGPLPAKPVAITFDDGFENQMEAFTILQRHHMKATFYIINGGQASNWCIGAGRKRHLPSQPPTGCGDDYLTWDQVRELDQSGLITIGGHTLDHENLATLPPAEQRQEIFESKAGIEAEVGHPIYDFAYPYGAYNDTTIELVKEAGYDTAVSTLPDNNQSPAFQYTLRRVRDATALP